MKRETSMMTAAVLAGLGAAVAHGATVYSDNFDTDTSANYSVNQTPGATGNSSTAIFAFDYSTLGIPSAPHSTGGTTIGVKTAVDSLQASTNPPNVLGAITVSTKNVGALTTPYVVQVDVWGNYIGGTNISASGTNGTTAAALAIGTAGTTLVSPNASDAALFETFHDGGNSTTSNSDYRAYVATTGTATNTTNAAASTGYYAAGTSTTAKDNTNAYYSFLPSVSAPTLQQTNYASTQTGSSPAGVIGFRWTTWTITNDGTNVTWAINGTTIATVPLSAYNALGGGQVAFGSIDSGLTGAYDATSALLNSDIWDNLTVTTTPEPTSLALLGFAGAGLLARRRRA